MNEWRIYVKLNGYYYKHVVIIADSSLDALYQAKAMYGDENVIGLPEPNKDWVA